MAQRGQRVQWRRLQLAAAHPYTRLLAASSTGVPTQTPSRGSLAAASAARHDLLCGSGVSSCTAQHLTPPGGDAVATHPVWPPAPQPAHSPSTCAPPG